MRRHFAVLVILFCSILGAHAQVAQAIKLAVVAVAGKGISNTYNMAARSANSVGAFVASYVTASCVQANCNTGVLANIENAISKGYQSYSSSVFGQFNSLSATALTSSSNLTYLDLVSAYVVKNNGVGVIGTMSTTASASGTPYLTLLLSAANTTNGTSNVNLYINPNNPLEMSLKTPPVSYNPATYALSGTTLANYVSAGDKSFTLSYTNSNGTYNSVCDISHPYSCISVVAGASGSNFVSPNSSFPCNPCQVFLSFSNAIEFTNYCKNSGGSCTSMMYGWLGSGKCIGTICVPTAAQNGGVSPDWGFGNIAFYQLTPSTKDASATLCGKTGWLVGTPCPSTDSPSIALPAGVDGASPWLNSSTVQSLLTAVQSTQPVTPVIDAALVGIGLEGAANAPNPDNKPLLPYPYSTPPISSAGSAGIQTLAGTSTPSLGDLTNPVLSPGTSPDLTTNVGSDTNTNVCLGSQCAAAASPSSLAPAAAAVLAPSVSSSSSAGAIGAAVASAVSGSTAGTGSGSVTNNYIDNSVTNTGIQAPANWYDEGAGVIPTAPPATAAKSWLDPIFSWAPGLSNFHVPAHQSTCSEISVDLTGIHPGMHYQISAICSFSAQYASLISGILLALYSIAGIKIVLTA